MASEQWEQVLEAYTKSPLGIAELLELAVEETAAYWGSSCRGIVREEIAARILARIKGGEKL